MITVLLAGALLSASPLQQQQQTFDTDTTVSVSAGTRLKLENVGGEVIIKAWDKNQVRVQASHSSRTAVDINLSESSLRLSPKGSRGTMSQKNQLPLAGCVRYFESLFHQAGIHHGPSQSGRVALELPSPETMRDDNNTGSVAYPIFLRRIDPANSRANTEDGEVACRCVGTPEFRGGRAPPHSKAPVGEEQHQVIRTCGSSAQRLVSRIAHR